MMSCDRLKIQPTFQKCPVVKMKKQTGRKIGSKQAPECTWRRVNKGSPTSHYSYTHVWYCRTAAALPNRAKERLAASVAWGNTLGTRCELMHPLVNLAQSHRNALRGHVGGTRWHVPSVSWNSRTPLPSGMLPWGNKIWTDPFHRISASARRFGAGWRRDATNTPTCPNTGCGGVWNKPPVGVVAHSHGAPSSESRPCASHRLSTLGVAARAGSGGNQTRVATPRLA